ncbi:hypothetical protein T8A63_19470 (plasmid) [Sulfitobacter sp. OXR-159]|uniref:hypothetical protein n=1 Tax=Sulfitobacter sp. OXR-159 TaxID=3100174 RepID=UPI002AC909F0|nr:hypothetical protein [Sulfitobacter sp. OXR-159]WPZ31681.1 hypothetical protein T8A63_19470 [Sulfitobacter sp. OXR-159]
MTRWYRIIVGDVTAQPNFSGGEPFEQAAIRLAEAESRLERITKAERDYFLEMHDRAEQGAGGMSRLERLVTRFEGKELDYEDEDVLLMFAENPKGNAFHSGAARVLARSSPTRPAAMRKTLKTLQRYRRDAESARRTALKAWIRAQT